LVNADVLHWIAFTGLWGRLFLSPAHHQIHHSTNPIHFDKNLGSCLGIWDWLFGTLYVPGRTREKLRFGVEPKSQDAHTATGGLVTPLYNAFSHIKPLLQPRRAPTPPRGAVSAD
jgi:sterol desaturase/sphingolipid hydroxylase (fatty acid hydroxylase superfamily)